MAVDRRLIPSLRGVGRQLELRHPEPLWEEWETTPGGIKTTPSGIKTTPSSIENHSEQYLLPLREESKPH